MTREHTIKTSARVGTLTVTEHSDRIEMRLTFDRYGELGDAAEIARQLWPVLSRYDSDPRPLDFDAPDFGRRTLIDTDSDGRAFAVVTQEPRQ